MTCQICARIIKANTGLIAHHGYQRPYRQGWQTGSCPGARHEPYEVSCDIIPPTIEAIADYVKSQSARLAEFIANPPAEITRETNFLAPKRETFQRPPSFDPNGDSSQYRGWSYENEYYSTRYQIQSNIKHGTADVERLKKRLADWNPPQK